jgi:hypothetical protein
MSRTPRDSTFDRLLDETPDPEYDELTSLEKQITKMVAEGASDAMISPGSIEAIPKND